MRPAPSSLTLIDRWLLTARAETVMREPAGEYFTALSMICTKRLLHQHRIDVHQRQVGRQVDGEPALGQPRRGSARARN